MSQLRQHLFPIMKLMRESNGIIQVILDDVVYELKMTPTSLKPKRRRMKVKNSAALIQNIVTEICEACGSLRFNGVCMNRACPSNVPVAIKD